MKSNKKRPFIILIIWIFISGYTFINKGIEKGYQDWRFYAALVGVLIPLVFGFLIFKSSKKQ
ncbi:hypothetical protein [Lacinutrix undariae]